MYIGSLLSPQSGAKITYRYQTRGGKPCFPSLKREAEEKPAYDMQGAIFHDGVSFDGTVLLNTCIDIVFSADTHGKSCYWDSIRFFAEDPSALGEMQILCQGKPAAYLEGSSKQEVVLTPGVTASEITLRIYGNWKHLSIAELDILGAVDSERTVYPQPKEYIAKEGYMPLPVGVAAMPGTEFAVKDFAEKYEMLTEKELPIGEGNLCFALDSSLQEEEFYISVGAEKAAVRGGSLRALVYAGAKLLQLCSEKGIAQAEIHDLPFMKLRGIHISLPNWEDAEFLRRLIRFVIAPMGYNTVFIELTGVMEYKKHPELNAKWEQLCREYEEGKGPKPAHYGCLGHKTWKQEEVKDFCAYIRSFGLQIIPEVQTFGHTQYITTVYPELAEIEPQTEPEKINLFAADAKPAKKFYHCMCPNHPDYYKITFDIIDEVIDVFAPEEYVHIGHDEIYSMGKCPRCKDIPAGEIYAAEVTRLRDHLAERGLKTMLWSDMMEEDMYESAKGVTLVPKDIVGLSFTWYFHLDEELNIEDRILKHGFSYMMGNMYSSHYPRFEQRRENPTLLGAEVSTWVYSDERTYAYEGKMYDFIYSAQMFWSKSYHSNLRQTYDEIIRRRMPVLRNWIRYNAQPKCHRFILPMPALSSEVPYALRNLYSAAIASQGEISVQNSADRLVFLHALDAPDYREPWAKPAVVGDYTVHYTDGDSVEIPISYGLELIEYSRKHGTALLSALFRHEGYLGTWYAQPLCQKDFLGKDVTLYEYTWENPHPEKVISSVSMHSHSEQNTNMVLFGLYAELTE